MNHPKDKSAFGTRYRSHIHSSLDAEGHPQQGYNEVGTLSVTITEIVLRTHLIYLTSYKEATSKQYILWKNDWLSQLWASYKQLRNKGLDGIRTHDLCARGEGEGGVLPKILDRGVPRRFLNPNPI